MKELTLQKYCKSLTWGEAGHLLNATENYAEVLVGYRI